MGNLVYNSIIVSHHNLEKIEEARSYAMWLYDFNGDGKNDSLFSPVVGSSIHSFFIAPHGSKEGWERAIKLQEANASIIHWLEIEGGFEYVEVAIGGNDFKSQIIASS